MAGLSDNPAPSQATTTEPIALVPHAEQRWSFHFKEPEAHEVDEELTALRSEMGAQTRMRVQKAEAALEGADTTAHCPSER